MSLPPGPRAPAVVQTLEFLKDPLGFLRRCYARYGDVFTLREIGFGTEVMVSSPALLKELFTGPPEVLHAGEANERIFGSITGTQSSFILEEQAHLRRRRLLLPSFHGDRMHEYGDTMRRQTEKAVASWPLREEFALHPEMQSITLHVILHAVFGLGQAANDSTLEHLLTRTANEAVASMLLILPPLQRDLGRWSPWGRLLHLIHQMDEALLAEIARRRREGAKPEQRDILSLLLQARYENGEGLSDGELHDELVTLLMAGHETTGTSLTWAMECILSHPEVEQRLRAELDDVLGDEQLGHEHLTRLEYLDAVIKESIRYRPIMPTGGARLVKRPFSLGGYELPPGVWVINALSVVHHRSDLYPEPDVFRPERFLGRRVDPYEWTPFGGGVRRCLGMAFALYEMKVVLATVLRSARLELARSPVKARRRGFFIAPENGLPVRVLSRLRRAGDVPGTQEVATGGAPARSEDTMGWGA
ncbi:cytochrome P450 [Archangium violaceum]|nr:cytochrome P450 [Archangium violaceum]